MSQYSNQARCKDDEMRLGIHTLDYTLPAPVITELKAAVISMARRGLIIDWVRLHHELCVANPAWPGSVPHLIVYRPFLPTITRVEPDQLRAEFADWIAKPEAIQAIMRGLDNTIARMDYTDEKEDRDKRIWMIEWLWNVPERGTDLMMRSEPDTFKAYMALIFERAVDQETKAKDQDEATEKR